MDDALDRILKSAARRYARPLAPAEDLLQEARIAVWQARPHFDPARGDERTYLVGRAYGAILHYLRDRARLIRLPHAVEEAGEGFDAALPLDRHDYPSEDPRAEIDSRIWVEQMTQDLPDRQRTIVRLHAAGLNDSEIGRRLCMPSSNVRKMKNHAILALRRQYATRSTNAS